MLRRDVVIAPLFEGFLILVMAVVTWVAHNPFIFASLGPTAYELVETPERPTARPYNILVGHLIGVLAGFVALYATGATHAAPWSQAGMPLPRVWAAALAATLTVAVTLIARATQPAAIATSLLVSLGTMQAWKDGVLIMGAVLLMTILGEPIRRWRLAKRNKS